MGMEETPAPKPGRMDSLSPNELALAQAKASITPAVRACRPLSRFALSTAAVPPAELRKSKDIVDDKKVYATCSATYVSIN
jgi:hypothetical protein